MNRSRSLYRPLHCHLFHRWCKNGVGINRERRHKAKQMIALAVAVGTGEAGPNVWVALLCAQIIILKRNPIVRFGYFFFSSLYLLPSWRLRFVFARLLASKPNCLNSYVCPKFVGVPFCLRCFVVASVGACWKFCCLHKSAADQEMPNLFCVN